jgi:hypothetical protein
MNPIRILLQTTIPFAHDDWHAGRFSLLARELANVEADGRRVEVMARDRGSTADDPILSRIDESPFDEVWILAVDTGGGLTDKERESLARFQARGGGLLTARDHQDLGSCLALLPGPGRANYFHTRNLDPIEENRCDDDCQSKGISWPNYHSGKNGDVQAFEALEPVHPLLRRPDGTTLEHLPSHPHEGAIGAPAGETARVIARGKSLVTGKRFNLIVALQEVGKGRAVVESSFHHFADYNWDTRSGAPSFVTDPEGTAIRDRPELLHDVKTYVGNLALWLAGR